MQDLPGYIATPGTAKHRVFQFLETTIAPDYMLVAIASADAYHLGVLSSRLHVAWAATAGDGWAWVMACATTAVDAFLVTSTQQDRIREVAEQLDTLRKQQQAQHSTLTLTDLYNVVEKLRVGQSLTPKEQVTNQLGLASVVLNLHQQLDREVAAYGWAVDLSETELLTKLVQFISNG